MQEYKGPKNTILQLSKDAAIMPVSAHANIFLRDKIYKVLNVKEKNPGSFRSFPTSCLVHEKH